MLSTHQQTSLEITESKIIHKSGIVHPLARFVTEETAALLFHLQPEQIYKITCWRHVVHVHGKGVSRFVSYADFPPIFGVEAPREADMVRWRQRWRRKWKIKQAPHFWTEFYAHQFKKAASMGKLLGWGKLVAKVKPALSQVALQQLRQVYNQEKLSWEKISASNLV